LGYCDREEWAHPDGSRPGLDDAWLSAAGIEQGWVFSAGPVAQADPGVTDAGTPARASIGQWVWPLSSRPLPEAFDGSSVWLVAILPFVYLA
jgi:hypothetical protein